MFHHIFFASTINLHRRFCWHTGIFLIQRELFYWMDFIIYSSFQIWNIYVLCDFFNKKWNICFMLSLSSFIIFPIASINFCLTHFLKQKYIKYQQQCMFSHTVFTFLLFFIWTEILIIIHIKVCIYELSQNEFVELIKY